MKLCWLTDIHLNFLKSKEIFGFLKLIDQARPDRILIGGDIGEAHNIIDYLKMIDDHFTIPIYFVLGNHDFYRGSIKQVKENIKKYLRNTDNLIWLDDSKPIKLTEEATLVGHSSWADGEYGDFQNSPVMLNDYSLIHEFAYISKTEQLYKMKELAQEAVNHFDSILQESLDSSNHVICLTHAPPFKESTWHKGKISDNNWLPHFSSKVVGEILVKYMTTNKDKKMTVLCGHTHGEGYVKILDNLEVYTGKAMYGNPEIQKIISIE